MADVKAAAPRPSASQATHSGKSTKSTNFFWINLIIVVACVIVAELIYNFVLGTPNNFLDGADRAKPKPGNLMATMYEGGFIVPILMGMLLVVICFTVERFITIFKSKGSMDAGEFVRKVQYHLANKNIDSAISECDKQSGSVGNVMRSGLVKYRDMTVNNELETEQKIIAIQKEIEEATALELPMLEKNLVFLSTITTCATLLGLLGTVLGMIRSFQAMANTGSPDPGALAGGISEALINTAFGISTSFIAVIMYNFFTTIIDGITFGIDESGFTLTQSFASNYK